MKNLKKTTTLTALALAGTAYSLSADPVEAALDASKAKLSETIPGKISVNARLRYEVFDAEGGLDVDGTTIRARYGYTTPNFNGFTAMVEGETVSRVGGDAGDMHPLDAPGDGTDLNQLWVQYADEAYGKVKLGRQIYTLDDHRFVGHVGWRQNIQVFDAATFDYTGIDKLSMKGFFIDERHLVTGAHNKTDSYGLNVSYAFSPKFKLTGFYYDMEGEDAAATTNKTIGLRAVGSFAYEDIKFKYAFSLAEQSDAGATGSDPDAGYLAGDLSTSLVGLTLGAGFEVLEPGFRTPYATVHKFNGFADVFAGPSLTGIAGGLEDYYIYAGYKIPVGNGIQAKVIYHWFDPENGGGSYGEELDFVASYSINKYFSAVVKYGTYEADSDAAAFTADKDMFTIELNFKY
ncbi:MAG: alginate export family protein [Opitutales bacterium]